MTVYKDIKRIPIVAADVPNLAASKITSGTLDNARITLDAAEIPNLATSKITTGTMADARISASSVTQHAATYDDNKLQTNVALLGFKTAVNGSLAKYNLVDQIVDEYTDATGVDASASTNENLVSGKYNGQASSSGPTTCFGDGSDGSLTTSGNVTHTVQNKNGAYDGDMLIKQYTDLTISSGHTMTVDQPCRGMMILCTGNCTITGTLTMNNKGASANPTASGGSDSNAVSTNGLQIGFQTSGGSQTLDNASANFNGCGTAARTAINGFNDMASNGTIFTIPRIGGVGHIGGDQSSSGSGAGGTGGTVSGGTGGGGSGGGSWDTTVLSTTGYVRGGGDGSCFVGGSGGGALGGTTGQSIADITATNAADYGGVGGTGTGSTAHGNYCAEGGMGNPTGTGFCVSSSCTGCDVTGGATGKGGGGLIWLIVKGNLTITGTISSNGGTPHVNTPRDAPASSGGGVIVYNYGGTLSSSGTIQAIGGTSAAGTNADGAGGPGGAGSVQTGQVLTTGTIISDGADLTLQSNDTTSSTANPNYADMVILMEDAHGTATLDTDIKGYISEDSGVTFTQGTLVDEGTWGTNKKIIAFHDLDISAQTGSAMCYKITTHNQSAGSKETKIHATSIGWR